MARIKLAYIGGGSTRAPGTMTSLIEQGENFDGSDVILIDLNPEHLEVVKTLAEKLARHRGMEIRVSATTDRRSGLQDCDVVLTSYRPGGYEARALDERIPLNHGVIGQETQGPGGFFMALRAIHVMKEILADMEAVCPRALLVNYTNPINIVSEAVSHHSDIPIISLCEGPIVFPQNIARTASLEPEKVDAIMIGLNHGSWTVRHMYDGQDMIPLIANAYARRQDDPSLELTERRMLALATRMGAIPAFYFQYYYFEDELLAEMRAKPTTRAEDIMAKVPGYWQHYREQAASDVPALDPQKSRRGIFELEIAIDVLDALYNDRGEVWPINVPNNGALPDFPDDLVVEVPGLVDRSGAKPLPQGHLPRHLLGLVEMLGEYQAVTAEVAWNGTRGEAVRALASNPLCLSLAKAEAIYDEMAAALRDYLPERLVY